MKTSIKIALASLIVALLACAPVTPAPLTLTPSADSTFTVTATALVPANTLSTTQVTQVTATNAVGGELVRSDDSNWSHTPQGGREQLVWLYDRDFASTCLLVVRTSNQQLATRLLFDGTLHVWGIGAFARTFALSSDVSRITIVLDHSHTVAVSLRCTNINFPRQRN